MEASSRDYTAFLLLLCLIFITYGNTFHATWHLDDPKCITHNSQIHIKDLLPGSLIQTFFAHPSSGNRQNKKLYRPLSCMTFAINWYFGKTNVVGYHLVNITIHFFTAFFLYLTVYNILKTPNMRDRYHGNEYFIALLTATLWAINPIQTQAVTYIVQRMASMAAMFYILSLFFYIKGKTANSRINRKLFFIGCFLSYLFGLASKENVVILPVALVLVETVFFRDLNQVKTRKVLFWVTVGGGLFVIVLGSLLFLQGNPFSIVLKSCDARFFTPMQRLMTEPRIVVYYLSQIFYPVPTRLSIEHNVLISTSLFRPWTTLPSIGLVLGLIALGSWQIRKMPVLSFAILFFFLNHLIESSVLCLEPIFEHRNYLPSLFLFFPVSIGIKRMLDYYHDKKRSMFYTMVSFFILILVGVGSGTYIRNMAWATERSLWEDAMAKAPEMMRPVHNLAWGYYEKNGQYDKTLKLYDKALNLKAHTIYHRLLLLSNMAKVYFNTGRYRKSVDVWKEAINAYPEHADYAELVYGLAFAQSRLGDWEKAIANIEIAISERANRYNYINLKGFLLLKEKKYEEAIPFFRKSLDFKPDYSLATENMGICLSLMQNYDRAEWFFRHVHARYPKDIIILLWLIEVNLRADDKGDVDLYTDKLFAIAGVNNIVSTLQAISKKNVMSRTSEALLIREIARKIREKSNKIARFGEYPKGSIKK